MNGPKKGRSTAPSRKRILVVDDQEEVTQVVVEILTANGFDAWAVNDPLQVLPQATEMVPHLILLDQNMPSLQGDELTVLLKSRSETRDIPIIFLSGLTDHESHTSATFSGAVAYLHKPINTQEFLEQTILRSLARTRGV